MKVALVSRRGGSRTRAGRELGVRSAGDGGFGADFRFLKNSGAYQLQTFIDAPGSGADPRH